MRTSDPDLLLLLAMWLRSKFEWLVVLTLLSVLIININMYKVNSVEYESSCRPTFFLLVRFENSKSQIFPSLLHRFR